MQPYFMITREEMAALAGEPHAACVLYLHIRQRMDLATGLVGARKGAGVSWQAFSEALYVEPKQGLDDTGRVHKESVRRLAARLQRCGLISNETKDRRLIIRCLLAHVTVSENNGTPPIPHFSASKKPDTNPTDTRQTKPDTQVDIVDNRVSGLIDNEKQQVEQHQPDRLPDTNPTDTRQTKADSHQISDIRGGSREDISNIPRARVEQTPPLDTSLFFALLGDLARQHGQLDFRLENSRGDPRVRAMAEHWMRSQVPLPEFAQLVAERLAKYPDLDRVSPAYFANPVAEYIAGRTASAQPASQGAPQVRQGGGGGNARDTSTTPEQDREQRKREDENTLRRAAALGLEQAEDESLFELRMRVDREEVATRARKRRGVGSREGLQSVREIISQGRVQ